MSLIFLKQCNRKLLRPELFWRKQKDVDSGGKSSWELDFLYQTVSQVKHWGERTEAGETCGFVSLHLSSLWDGWAEDLPVHFWSTVRWLKLLVRTFYQCQNGVSLKEKDSRKKRKSMWNTQNICTWKIIPVHVCWSCCSQSPCLLICDKYFWVQGDAGILWSKGK